MLLTLHPALRDLQSLIQVPDSVFAALVQGYPDDVLGLREVALELIPWTRTHSASESTEALVRMDVPVLSEKQLEDAARYVLL